MADIKVPNMGESVTEATIAKWFKKVGDSVAADEPLAELETDKVTVEVPAPEAGVITSISVEAGGNVQPGSVIGAIGEGGGTGAAKPAPKPDAKPEAKPEAKAAPKPEAKTAEAKPAPDAKPEPAPATAKADPAAQPESRAEIAGLRERADEEDNQDDVVLAPSVRRIATETGTDPASVKGTGKDGRVTKGDILAAVDAIGTQVKAGVQSAAAPPATPSVAPAAKPAAPAAPRVTGEREQRVKMSRLRQTIAKRLKDAQNTAAMLTTFNEVDMTEIMALRKTHQEAFEKRHGVRIGFMSFFVKACVAALKEVPSVNGEIDGDDIIYKNFYDIGVAVGTEKGLVVPVLRDADSKGFADIEKGISELGGRARDGKLKLEDLQGATFTISNGGVYGSLMSTPILNAPQAGVLGMHKIQDRPMAVNGQVVIRPMMYLALSYDHRLVDGKEAVTFLVHVKEALENPVRLLLEV